jgi:hypothetical protein
VSHFYLRLPHAAQVVECKLLIRWSFNTLDVRQGLLVLGQGVELELLFE